MSTPQIIAKRGNIKDDKFNISELLGHGAFGTVHKAKNLETGENVALKRVNLIQADKLFLMREVLALRNCKHPNIVELLDVLCSPWTITLVMEFMDYNLNEVTALFLFKQLLKALSHLVEQGIMHRDIKPSNILINAKHAVKLADFGQACLFFPNNARSYKEQVGSRWYRAPELLFGHERYTPSVDWWAAGCVLAEMLSGVALFKARTTPFTLRIVDFQGRSDLEQISLIFRLLGTPTRDSWPEFSEMPDSSKIMFETTLPRGSWSNAVGDCSEATSSLLSSLLSLSASMRTPPAILLNSPLFSSLPAKISRDISKPRKRVCNPLSIDTIFNGLSL